MKLTKTSLKEFFFTILIIIGFVALVAALSFILLPSLKIYIKTEELLRAFEIILFVFICCTSVYLININLNKKK